MAMEPIRVAQGEATVEELLDWLRAGHRVIVEREMLGTTHEVTLRYDGEVFYCDTPTTLHRHETADGMRRCLVDQRYGRG